MWLNMTEMIAVITSRPSGRENMSIPLAAARRLGDHVNPAAGAEEEVRKRAMTGDSSGFCWSRKGMKE
jgi:hypothetical protein